MQSRLTTKPIDEVIVTINQLDLESVKVRVMDPKSGEGWTREYAERIAVAYKRYLAMLVKYPDDCEDILISQDVDEFWHTHILQTRKYFDDCQLLFGNYLHHEPQAAVIEQKASSKRIEMAEKTRRLYEKEFGEGQEAAMAWSGAATEARDAAMCGMAIEADKAAMCGMAIKADKAAMCGMAIKADKAAMCGMAVS